MAESQDVNTLKRRGRRRLVGAVALVLLAVIVLPMVFDSEPGRRAPAVSVRIPSEDTPFSPAVPAKPLVAAVPEPQGSPAPTKPAPRVSDTEHARAEAALANAEYVVPVAALASQEKVKELTQRLAAAKVPYYTESVATASGQVTRVRAGPFASREAAEKALQKLKGLGLNPGNVATKSG
ncbi:MAG: SPOR domain-containing protein [Burkholderiales bacterium]